MDKHETQNCNNVRAIELARATAGRPVGRQLLVERVELRLADCDDPVDFAVRGKEVANLGQAPQSHCIGRHQLVLALVHEEA